MTYLTQLRKVINNILQILVYYNYKVDIYILYYASNMPGYLVFLFCFLFGSFGSSQGISQNVLALKYLCFLSSWYIIATSLFVFISFQIPTFRDYLYDTLGKDFVISHIGNPGVKPLTKLGGVAIGAYAVNEVGKAAVGYSNERLAGKAVENYKEMVKTTGQPADPNSKEYKEVCKTSNSILSQPRSGPLDRTEEKIASGHLADTIKDGLLKGIGWRK